MISFIIPAYNAESCIVKCLDSITMQTYNEYEIIVVNDGSTDNTRDILDSYQNLYNHVDISVYHVENRGHGTARNFGVSKAKNEYIWFIDADDILYNNGVVKTAVEDMQREKPDIYIFSVYETDYKNRNIYWHYAKKDKATTIYDSPFLLFKQNWVWNKPINRKFLLKSNVEFSSCKMFEDIYYFCDLYQKAKKIYISTDIKYVYVKHDEALTSVWKNFTPYPKALFHELKTFLRVLFKKKS